MDQNTERKPEVSIMLCTYNRTDLFSIAIKSVLAQTFQNWELLILDDASTDNTEYAVQEFLNDARIRYIRHPKNIGITKNRNAALKEARGAFIAVLDSDDTWLDSDKLQRQCDFLTKEHEYALVGTNMVIIDNGGSQLKKIYFAQEDVNIRRMLLVKNQIAHSSVMYRKELALSVGGYNEHLDLWEDWDLWLKLGSKAKFKNLPLFALGYRKHQSNITNNDKKKGIIISLNIIKTYRSFYPHYIVAVLKLYLKLGLLTFNL